MKKAFLLSISLFFTYSTHAMSLPTESARQRWEKLVANNPDAKNQIDQFLKEEVAKYHPGFTDWRWQEVNRPRTFWDAITEDRIIYIPYADLLSIHDYIEGQIPKQAILSLLTILYHEIIHIIKYHAHQFHPRTQAERAYEFANVTNASKQEKKTAKERLLHQGLYCEWVADYGIPNIPNIVHAASGLFKSTPPPQESDDKPNIHPHPMARFAAMQDRYAKLKVGKQINSQKLPFAQDKLPQITGTTPIKAANILGIEDPYYYPSLSQEDHPFDVTLMWNQNRTITLPYHVAVYSRVIEDFIKNNPQSSMTYQLKIKDILDPNISLDTQDMLMLKDILTRLEKAFYEGMITNEVINGFISSIESYGMHFTAHIAALADLFKIPLINDAIKFYYTNVPKAELMDEVRTYYDIMRDNSSTLAYGAKHVLHTIEKQRGLTLLYK